MNFIKRLIPKKLLVGASSIILALFTILIIAGTSEAACTFVDSTHYTCPAGSTAADINAAINDVNFLDGGTITLAPGGYSWGFSVPEITFSNNKGVTLACATPPLAVGAATTNPCSASIGGLTFCCMDGVINGNNTHFYRLTGITFSQGNIHPSTAMKFSSDGTNPTGTTLRNLRIDHNTFDSMLGTLVIQLADTGNNALDVFGVADHNLLTGSDNFTFLEPLGRQNPSLTLSSVRGTINNFFLENNTFNFTNLSNVSAGCYDNWNGGMVIRYENITNCEVIQHDTLHGGGPLNFEFYNNSVTFTSGCGSSNCFQDGWRMVHLQGGGEVYVYNNTFNPFTAPINMTTFRPIIAQFHYRTFLWSDAGGLYSSTFPRCDGTNTNTTNIIDANSPGISPSTGLPYLGYPCWRQPGRAPDGTGGPGTLAPIYIWNNRLSSNWGGGVVTMGLDNCAAPNCTVPPDLLNHIALNRDLQNEVPSFNGTSGMGFGPTGSRPTQCTTFGDLTDAGKGGVGYFDTTTNTLYRCSVTGNPGTWTVQYQPFTYPHPLTYINAATCNLADVQAAVNSAHTGDTVSVPAGTCNWGSSWLAVDTQITVMGAGKDVTNITCSVACVVIGGVTPLNTKSARITGFTFTGNVGLQAIIMASGKGWRIDHSKLQSQTQGATLDDRVWALWARIGPDGTSSSLSSGLLDHIQFINTQNVTGIQDTLYSGSALWASPLGLGDDNAVYIEDSTSVFQGLSRGLPDGQDGDYGGRWVWRFSSIQDTSLDCHSLQSIARACRRWEAYNVHFIHTAAPGSGYFFFLRGGTGMTFNNTVDAGYGDQAFHMDNVRSFIGDRTDHNFYCVGDEIGVWANANDGVTPARCLQTPVYSLNDMAYCDNISPGNLSGWDGNIHTTSPDAGWPCRDQIGMGGDNSLWTVANPYPTQFRAPAYFWNNTVSGGDAPNPVHITNGADPYIVENRDWFRAGASFNGTSGVGIGTKAQMQAITTCTQYTGFWVTNEGSWNLTLPPNTSGQLYQCGASNNWVLYYTPLQYPHPLQAGTSTVVSNPTAPSKPTGLSIASVTYEERKKNVNRHVK